MDNNYGYAQEKLMVYMRGTSHSHIELKDIDMKKLASTAPTSWRSGRFARAKPSDDNIEGRYDPAQE